ncbi:peptidase T [uncultured Dialister sp.]|uniref:peptidase T n=1 Tax=uncultured Dialister sp. TaxID=278064 RepID=UPI0025DCCF5E|nr:peptidase T [uncultured Dialister sp.]
MELDRDTLVRRFMDYISYNTRSDEENDKVCPSTPGQMVLAKHLKEELEELGLSDVTVDDNGYVMATLSANGEEGSTVGFISHMDTSPDAPGGPIHARIVKNYDGKDILLNKDKQIVLSVKDFPEIRKYEGQDIMVTDGTTLLGSDDKAGITAIVSAMEYLLHHPEVKHGKIRIAFTPDEETGRSPLKFDVKAFGADFAYTVDGGELGGLEYENFNAANPVVTIRGRSVHTGDAKGKMVNAISIASEWQTMLPDGEKPECTEGREGFFHVYKIRGTVEECTLDMLVRDHDSQKFQLRKDFLLSMADFLNKKYGEGTVMVELNDVYFNMMDIIEKGHMDIVELARDAMKAAGVTPVELPIRGGTDGAQLSFKGLPCPNLFTGGANFHSRFEYLPLDSMEKACETVIEIARRAWKIGKK